MANLYDLASSTSKCCSFPHTASDKLEWSRGDFLSCGSYTNDNRLTPALMARLQSCSLVIHKIIPFRCHSQVTYFVYVMRRLHLRCCACSHHGVDVSNAFKSVVKSTISQPNQYLLNGLVVVFRVDTFCCTKLLS